MIRIIKNLLLYVLISFGLLLVSSWLKSEFIVIYLSKDLIITLITLFGLNVAVLSILVSKLSDIQNKLDNLDIKQIVSEMKFSLLEFFTIIIIAFLSSTLSISQVVNFQYKDVLFNSISLSTLIYSLVIIWDTGHGIFILISEENESI